MLAENVHSRMEPRTPFSVVDKCLARSVLGGDQIARVDPHDYFYIDVCPTKLRAKSCRRHGCKLRKEDHVDFRLSSTVALFCWHLRLAEWRSIM